MSIYASFFSPQVISILLCLEETTGEGQEINQNTQIFNYLIQKILCISEASQQLHTNQEFEAEVLSIPNGDKLLDRYRAFLSEINCFNDFYRKISNTLKSLRSLRNNKIEQGNLIDFLVRRLYIYFEKLDFKEIVGIYEAFEDYVNNRARKRNPHEFQLTKSIEEVKFNLENYQLPQNPEILASIIADLATNDHTYKTSYLKGLVKAGEKVPVESIHEIHRYFDKCLGNLFQEKTESTGMSNKINHCILSTAYSSLQMGHLEECLQSISEGLRISQNNSDQESINNCIIYLYKIAQKLGKFREEILLAEHAITHSLNLTNISLMVFSCLSYSWFEKNYDCNDHSVALLKSRNISWTDALHFSKKKVYSNFESNCKNIYHSYRNLLIPIFLNKLAVLVHLPELQKLLINPYYKRKELMELQIFKEFKGSQGLALKLKQATAYFYLGQKKMLFRSLEALQEHKKVLNCPEELIKIWELENRVKFEEGSVNATYKSIQELVEYSQENGFVKAQLYKQKTLIIKLLIKQQMYFEALFHIEENLKECQRYQLNCQKLVFHLLQAQALLQLDHFEKPIANLQQIEESGQLQMLPVEDRISFYHVKLLLNQKVLQQIPEEYPQEKKVIIENQLVCLDKMLQLNLNLNYLREILATLQKIRSFYAQHASVLKIDKSGSLKRAIAFCENAMTTLENVEEEVTDCSKTINKIMRKIKILYSS